MHSPQQKQPRILVVDANPMSRQLTAEYLQSAGYDVVSAATGERDARRTASYKPVRRLSPSKICS